MSAPTLTTISDTLYAPNGVLVDGALFISNTSTMISPDGDEIPEGKTIAIRVVAGLLNVGLVPNLGATPNGTSYRVKYAVTDQWFVETWIVPELPNPAKLSDVRVLTPPIPNVMFSVQEVLPPSNMLPGQVLEWNGTQWVPGTGGGGGASAVSWFFIW